MARSFLFVFLIVASMCYSTLTAPSGASGFIQETKCSIVCTDVCPEGSVRVRDPTTLCHVYPCRCVKEKEEEKANSVLKPGADGKVLEGDILVLPAQEEIVLGVYGEIPMEKSIFHIKKFYWTKYKRNGLYYIPYILDRSITDPIIKQNIPDAIEEFRKRTCIRFIPRSYQENYVRIKSGRGCFSHIGMNGGEQTVSLANRGCRPKGTAIHELMHTLGFFHEQSRSDRDQYIVVNRRNIIKGLEDNFNKRSSAVSLGSPYDYGSVMHYGKDAFSRNGQDTIVPRRQTNAKIGQRDGFSDIDVDQINRLYPCSQMSAGSQVNPPPATTRRPATTRTTRGPIRTTRPTQWPIRTTRPTQWPIRTTRPSPRPIRTTRPTHRPIRTTKRTISKRPIAIRPTTPTKCRDLINNCKTWVDNGYCLQQSKYYNFAKQYCPVSCNACPKPQQVKLQTCVNEIKDNTCESWKTFGYCNHEVFKVFVKKRCAKSCNLCGDNVQKDEESPPMIQKDPMTFVEMDEMIDAME